MQAHPRIIGYLQRAVSHELHAVEQLTLQAVQAGALGMREFATALRGGANEELEHAQAFAERLLAVGAALHSGMPRSVQIGRTFQELLRYGLATEAEAIRLYTEAGRFCQQIGDQANAELFDRILADEQSHHRELEQALARLNGTH